MMESKLPKLLYTIKEMLEIIPMSKAGIYAAVKKGRIPSKSVGRRVFIPASFVDELLTPSKKQGA